MKTQPVPVTAIPGHNRIGANVRMRFLEGGTVMRLSTGKIKNSRFKPTAHFDFSAAHDPREFQLRVQVFHPFIKDAGYRIVFPRVGLRIMFGLQRRKSSYENTFLANKFGYDRIILYLCVITGDMVTVPGPTDEIFPGHMHLTFKRNRKMVAAVKLFLKTGNFQKQPS